MGDRVPRDIISIADGLEYRDFLTVGLLLKKLAINQDAKEQISNISTTLPDN
jgi:hypothetical protein